MKHVARTAQRGMGWFIFASGGLAGLALLSRSLGHCGADTPGAGRIR